MSNSWDHLPNAKHIDRIYVSLNRYPDIWYAAFCKWSGLIGYELRTQSWFDAEVKCMELDRLDIWEDDADLRIGPILALIAYNDCAHYLDMTSQELLTFALLGVTPAVLLLEAVLAFEEITKLEVTA